MINYYCLVTSDSNKEFGIDIFNKRIQEKKYPLYLRTPFLNEIKINDKVLFYIAGSGKNAQNFIGQAVIEKVETPNELLGDPDRDNYAIEKYLIFNDIKIFKTFKHIKMIIDKLDFIKNKNNYGIHFMGGVKKIPEKDFYFIAS